VLQAVLDAVGCRGAFAHHLEVVPPGHKLEVAIGALPHDLAIGLHRRRGRSDPPRGTAHALDKCGTAVWGWGGRGKKVWGCKRRVWHWYTHDIAGKNLCAQLLPKKTKALFFERFRSILRVQPPHLHNERLRAFADGKDPISTRKPRSSTCAAPCAKEGRQEAQGEYLRSPCSAPLPRLCRASAAPLPRLADASAAPALTSALTCRCPLMSGLPSGRSMATTRPIA